jgi:hypothetical protein
MLRVDRTLQAGLFAFWKVNNMKTVIESAEALLEKANACLELAEQERLLSDSLHQVAQQQLDNAAKQQEIARQQHLNADKLAAKASALDALGHSLEGKAVEMVGETHLVPRL